MTTIAVILAGGSGHRLGAAMPKQFLQAGGMPIIGHTIRAFEESPAIDEICVVVHPDHLGDVEALRAQNGFTKLRHIVAGGKERYDSAMVAIRACEGGGDDAVLLFHDAVRPLVSGDIISACVEAMAARQAVAVGVPATDTIWHVNRAGDIESVPDRSHLYCAQTPQCFRLHVIREAYERALADPAFRATDECGVVLRYLPDCPVHVIDGNRRNFKITYPEDLSTLELLLTCQPPDVS